MFFKEKKYNLIIEGNAGQLAHKNNKNQYKLVFDRTFQKRTAAEIKYSLLSDHWAATHEAARETLF